MDEKFENIDIRGTSPGMIKSVNLKECWNEKKYQVAKKFYHKNVQNLQ